MEIHWVSMRFPDLTHGWHISIGCWDGKWINIGRLDPWSRDDVLRRWLNHGRVFWPSCSSRCWWPSRAPSDGGVFCCNTMESHGIYGLGSLMVRRALGFPNVSGDVLHVSAAILWCFVSMWLCCTGSETAWSIRWEEMLGKGCFQRAGLLSNTFYPLVNSHNYGKSPFLVGKSTISMAVFNSFLNVYGMVYCSCKKFKKLQDPSGLQVFVCPVHFNGWPVSSPSQGSHLLRTRWNEMNANLK